MNRKPILLIAVVVAVVSLLTLLFVFPLKTVTEVFPTEYCSLYWWDKPQPVTVMLLVKKGWTLTGSYTSVCKGYEPLPPDCDLKPSFYIYAPNSSTIIFEQTGNSSGSFSIFSEQGGSYRVYMVSPEWSVGKVINVTLEAKQTGRVPLLELGL